MRRWTRWLGLFLGCLLIAGGVAETVRVVRSGDGGLLFWFGTLVGGGVLILIGTLLVPRRPTPGCVLVQIGCVVGLLPTMWTVIVPLMLVVLAIASTRFATATTGTSGRPCP